VDAAQETDAEIVAEVERPDAGKEGTDVDRDILVSLAGAVAGEGEHGGLSDERFDAAAERCQRGRPEQERDVDRGVGREGLIGATVNEGIDRVEALGQRRAGGEADLLARDRCGLGGGGRRAQRDSRSACERCRDPVQHPQSPSCRAQAERSRSPESPSADTDRLFCWTSAS
jgi:hypothetical protein